MQMTQNYYLHSSNAQIKRCRKQQHFHYTSHYCKGGIIISTQQRRGTDIQKVVVFHSLTPWLPNLNGVTSKSVYKCRQLSKCHTRHLRKLPVVYLLWKTKLAFLQERFFLMTFWFIRKAGSPWKQLVENFIALKNLLLEDLNKRHWS